MVDAAQEDRIGSVVARVTAKSLELHPKVQLVSKEKAKRSRSVRKKEALNASFWRGNFFLFYMIPRLFNFIF